MSYLTLLPASSPLAFIETWLVRIFVLLFLLTIGPWALLLLYDLLLYIFRAATYEIPVVGGRARGQQRPRAPSLSERLAVTGRRMSVVGYNGSGDGQGVMVKKELKEENRGRGLGEGVKEEKDEAEDEGVAMAVGADG